MTIAFPAGFHTAKAGTTTRSSTAAKRKPAYVNPTSGNHLDVFVDGVDETSGTTVTNSADGTQTLTLSIYSTTSHQIVAVETDSGLSNGQVLAIGESDVPMSSFNPGDVVSIGLTMLMNAVGIGITGDPTMGSDAVYGTPTNSPISYIDQGLCYTPGTGFNLYLYGADPQGGYSNTGFVSNPGAGLPSATLSSAVNMAGTSPPDSLRFPGGANNYFQIYYQSFSGGMLLTTNLTNPAAIVAQGAYGNNGLYPGVQALYYNNGPGPLYNAIGQINTNPIVVQMNVTPESNDC